MEPLLVLFGPGYCGGAITAAARAQGIAVTVVARAADAAAVSAALAGASHVLSTVPPDAAGDPVLQRYADALRAAPRLRWVGYLSSTGVYGDRGGGWVDEATPPAPTQPRSRQRLVAEQAWAALADHSACDLFRLAGIYGPGRSAFDALRAGTAQRILKPGHAFSRIHRDDVVQAVLAALRRPRGPGVRVLHLADDEPAESAAVTEEAARLLGLPPPPAIAFADAAMSPMARSFWAEDRKVACQATKVALGIAWRYPTYRHGLRGILREEAAEDGTQQREVLRP